MKKLLIFGLATFFLILVAIVAIPMFVNIDQFRPKIIDAVKENTHMDVALGKLSLSVFPSIKIKAEQIKLIPPAPFDKAPLLDTENASVSMPLYALLFAPRINLNLTEAKIYIKKSSEGSSLDAFNKNKESAEGNEKETATGESGLKALPLFLRSRVEAASVNLNIKESDVNFDDATIGENYKFQKLNLLLKGLGLNSKMTAELSTLSTVEKEGLMLKGPIVVKGSLDTRTEGDKISTDLDLLVDLVNMHIKSGNTFEKIAGIPLNFSLKGSAVKEKNINLDFPNASFNFSDLSMNGLLKVYELGSPEAQVELKVNSKNNKIEKLADFVKPIKDYSLKGDLNLNIDTKGNLNNPVVNAAFKISNASGKVENTGAEIKRFDMEASIKGLMKDPSVQVNPLILEVDNSKISIVLSGKGIENPDYNISVNSDYFNVDSTFLGKEAAAKDEEGNAKAKPQPLDQALNEAAPTVEEALSNPMLNKAKITFDLDIKKLIAFGASYSNINMKSSLVNRKLDLNQATMKAYNGTLSMGGHMQLDPKAPEFNFKSKLDNVVIEEMTKAHAPNWQKELGGKVKGDAAISGVGIRKEQLDKNLAGNFNVVILDGFTSIPVAKIMTQAIDKIPQAAANKASDEVVAGKFKTMSVDGNIAGREVKLNNLDIHFEPVNKQYGDFKFKAKGKVDFDRKIDLQGIAFVDPRVLKWPEAKGKSGDIEVPLRFKGSMDDPKPDFEYTVKTMSERILKQAVGQEVKKNKKKIIKEGEKALKKLFKF